MSFDDFRVAVIFLFLTPIIIVPYGRSTQKRLAWSKTAHLMIVTLLFIKKQGTVTSHFLRGRLYSVLLNLYFISCKTFRRNEQPVSEILFKMGIGETSPTSNFRRMARREIRENEQTCTGLHCLPKSTPLKQHIQIFWCFLIYAIQISSYASYTTKKEIQIFYRN